MLVVFFFLSFSRSVFAECLSWHLANYCQSLALQTSNAKFTFVLLSYLAFVNRPTNANANGKMLLLVEKGNCSVFHFKHLPNTNDNGGREQVYKPSMNMLICCNVNCAQCNWIVNNVQRKWIKFMIIYSYRDDLSTDCLLFCGKCYKFKRKWLQRLVLLVFSAISQKYNENLTGNFPFFGFQHSGYHNYESFSSIVFWLRWRNADWKVVIKPKS